MALTLNTLKAITTNKILPLLVDNFFDSNAAIKRTLLPGKMKKIDGGRNIQVPVIHSDDNGTDDPFFNPNDVLSVDQTDDVTAAVYAWKYQKAGIKVNKSEILQNKGDSGKISLLMGKMKVAKESMANNFGLAMFSDGTSDTGRETDAQYGGLELIVSATSTCGALAVADFATWKANVISSVGALSLGTMQRLFGQCSLGSKVPTVAYCKQNVYDQVWNLYQPHQRIVNEEMAKLGFQGIIEFNGVPVIVDSHAVAQKLYMINENHINFTAHKEMFMSIEEFDKLESFFGIMKRIYIMGNFVSDLRRVHGKLEGITVAS